MDFIGVDNDTVLSEPYKSLLERKPGSAIPYIVILSVVTIYGAVGNLLIILTFCRVKKAYQKGDAFLVQLATSDFMVTAVINPFAIAGVAYGERLYQDLPFELCKALGSICVILCSVSFLSIGNIAVNRYIFICHRHYYDKIYTNLNCGLICLLCWLIGFLLDLPSNASLSRHVFDLKSHKCIWDRNFAYGYTWFYFSVGVFIPLGAIVTFYALIFMKINQAKKNLMAHSDKNSKTSATLQSFKQARTMCFITIAFVSCWSPYILVMLLDRYDKYPLEVHLYASLTAHIHASLNFSIYGVTNKRIRDSYKLMVLNLVTCGKKGLGNKVSDGTTFTEKTGAVENTEYKSEAVTKTTDVKTIELSKS